MPKIKFAHSKTTCAFCKGMAGPDRGLIMWTYIMGGIKKTWGKDFTAPGQSAQTTKRSRA